MRPARRRRRVVKAGWVSGPGKAVGREQRSSAANWAPTTQPQIITAHQRICIRKVNPSGPLVNNTTRKTPSIAALRTWANHLSSCSRGDRVPSLIHAPVCRLATSLAVLVGGTRNIHYEYVLQPACPSITHASRGNHTAALQGVSGPGRRCVSTTKLQRRKGDVAVDHPAATMRVFADNTTSKDSRARDWYISPIGQPSPSRSLHSQTRTDTQ